MSEETTIYGGKTDETMFSEPETQFQKGLAEAEDIPDRPSTVWKEGDLLLETYEVLGVLGEGGMGRVYKVRHRDWNMELALKSPLAESLSVSGGRENFVREAETWVNLGMHPNIVQCYYVRSIDGIPRVFAECVEGGSLSDWIKSHKLYEGGKKAALERILDIAIQFGWGLHYAHQLGLVHQDVKPANVLITAEGLAKVTDFGLSRAKRALPDDSGNNGQRAADATYLGMTPAYCSPEQAEISILMGDSALSGKCPKLTLKTDIWSYAASLLEIFLGERTWEAGQAAPYVLEEYMQVGEGSGIVSTLPCVPEMPDEVKTILKRCFEQDPEQRPDTMLEICNVLKLAYSRISGKEYPRNEPRASELAAASYNNRAVSLMDLGRQEDAEELWRKAFEISPLHPQCNYNYYLVQWRAGRMTDVEIVSRIKQVYSEENILPALKQVNAERMDFDPPKDNTGNSIMPWTCRGELEKNIRPLHHFNPRGDSLDILAYNETQDTLEMWDAGNNRFIKKLRIWAKDIHRACIDHTGRYAVTGSNCGQIQLIDLIGGKVLKEVRNATGSFVLSLSISENGRLLSTGYERSMELWDLKTLELIKQFEQKSPIQTACLSRDGRYALSALEKNGIILWDLNTGCSLKNFAADYKTYALSFTPDGRYFVAGGSSSNLTLWELESGKCIRTMRGHTGMINSLSIDNSGRLVCSACDSTIRIWDLDTGCCIRTFEYPDVPGVDSFSDNTCVCFSSDGKFLISGGSKKSIRLWSIGSRERSRARYDFCVPVSGDEVYKKESMYRNYIAQLMRAEDGKRFREMAEIADKARSIEEFSRSGELMRFWSRIYTRFPRKSLRAAWKIRILNERVGGLRELTATSDNTHVLSVSRGATIYKLWELETGKCVRTEESIFERVNCPACRIPGTKLMFDSIESNEFYMRHIESIKHIQTYKGHKSTIKWLGVKRDGCEIISASHDGTIRFWEPVFCRCLRVIEAHEGIIRDVALTFDGKTLVSIGYDNFLKVWDVPSGNCRHSLKIKKPTILCLDASGKYVYVVSDTFSIVIIDIQTGKPVYTINDVFDVITAFCVTGDGRYLVAGMGDGSIAVWFLDWELDIRNTADWDNGIAPFLKNFLASHVPYSYELDPNRQPKLWEINLALHRRKRPVWDDEAFGDLIVLLECAGYGWIDAGAIRKRLEEMSRWKFRKIMRWKGE